VSLRGVLKNERTPAARGVQGGSPWWVPTASASGGIVADRLVAVFLRVIIPGQRTRPFELLEQAPGDFPTRGNRGWRLTRQRQHLLEMLLTGGNARLHRCRADHVTASHPGTDAEHATLAAHSVPSEYPRTTASRSPGVPTSGVWTTSSRSRSCCAGSRSGSGGCFLRPRDRVPPSSAHKSMMWTPTVPPCSVVTSPWRRLLNVYLFICFVKTKALSNKFSENMYDLAIIFPCYNEAGRIESTINAYCEYLRSKEAHRKAVLVLVNDGSTDDTRSALERLERYSQGNVTVTSVSYSQNKGKGFAIKQGILSADARVYGFTDADNSYPPDLLTGVLSRLQTADIVIGQRERNKQVSGYSRIRSCISNSLQKIVSGLFQLPFRDTQCGYKFFNKTVATTVLPRVTQDRFSFDIDFLMRAHEMGYTVSTIPISFSHQLNSSITWRDGARYLLDIVPLLDTFRMKHYRSLLIFLFITSTAISLALFGWVMWKGYFFSDDFTWLWHAQKIDSTIGRVLTYHMSTFYSPVINAFYVVFFGIWGYATAAPYFAAGLLVHVFVSFFTGMLVFRLTKSPISAVVSSILIALAGGAYEPLVWIGANMHSIATLFIICAVLLYTYYLSSYSRLSIGASFLFFILALGTKETAIVTPALLLLVFLYNKVSAAALYKHITHAAYWLCVAALSCFYMWQQYVWQSQSIWIESGTWQLQLSALLRIPFVVFDLFIPLALLPPNLANSTAVLLWIGIVTLFIAVIYAFRKEKIVLFGLGWILVTISPTLFFSTATWWEPMASRYTYLPRVGAVIILVGMLHSLVMKNKARYVIGGFVWFVILSVSVQTWVMIRSTTTEYAYVYTTGRTLSHAMEQLRDTVPGMVLVRPDRPFPNNNATIVGAASVIAGIPEQNIEFLKNTEDILLPSQTILLYWDHANKTYAILEANTDN